MLTQIHLVTSNQRKVEDYNRRLNNPNFVIKNVSVDLNEGRSLDIKEIAELKLKQAKEMLPNKKIMVEDRGFFVPALNNFPGPFVKIFLNSIGVDGLLKLMDGVPDRRANFVSVLAYFDGQKDHYFYDYEQGFLTNQKQGENLRGWTDILYVYGHQSFPDRSLASLSDSEWEKYLEEIEKSDFIYQFKSFLEG